MCNKEIIKINKKIESLMEKDISRKEISDGYHTFDELYFHRMILFSIICNQNKEKAWKSKLHHDKTMFDDYFIVGIETKHGQYSYHYKLEYWNYFNIKELVTAPEYDGHKPEDITRLLELNEFKNNFDRFEVFKDHEGRRKLRTPLAIIPTSDINYIEIIKHTNMFNPTKTVMVAVMKKTPLLPEEERITLMNIDRAYTDDHIERFIQILSLELQNKDDENLKINEL